MGPLDACTMAAELLCEAGFEFRYSSMKSEACYYGLPTVPDLIRIAAHKHDRGVAGLGKIVSRITFAAQKAGISELHVRNTVANGIGWYVLRSTGALAYKGRQPRRSSVKAA